MVNQIYTDELKPDASRDKGHKKHSTDLLRNKKTLTIFRENIVLVPFDILVILFVGQSMLPAWAAYLLAGVNFGTWWCYYRIPHFLRTVSGPLGDNILIPGPIVENFAQFIHSCGIHHRAHYGLMLAMMAGFHAAMTGSLWDMGIPTNTALFMGWTCFAGLLLIDTIMFWVSYRTLRDLQKDTLEDANYYTSELKRSNEDLEQFAYIASHDLRAPLRAMGNLTSWVSEDVKDVASEATKKHLTLLSGRINRLDRLLNDLLQYARVGKENKAPEYFSINDKAEEVFEVLNPEGRHEINITGPDLWVLDHDVTYDILISNLIGNAIKHNDKDRTVIAIDISRKKKGLQIVVEDNGPGISKEYQDKIFDVFYTMEARDKVEASGMGLALVKKIVTQKDGSVTVGDSKLGGVRFTLFLNIPTYSGKPSEAAADKSPKVSEAVS